MNDKMGIYIFIQTKVRVSNSKWRSLFIKQSTGTLGIYFIYMCVYMEQMQTKFSQVLTELFEHNKLN